MNEDGIGVGMNTYVCEGLEKGGQIFKRNSMYTDHHRITEDNMNYNYLHQLGDRGDVELYGDDDFNGHDFANDINLQSKRASALNSTTFTEAADAFYFDNLDEADADPKFIEMLKGVNELPLDSTEELNLPPCFEKINDEMKQKILLERENEDFNIENPKEEMQEEDYELIDSKNSKKRKRGSKENKENVPPPKKPRKNTNKNKNNKKTDVKDKNVKNKNVKKKKYNFRRNKK